MNITIFVFSGLIFTTNQYFGNIQGTNGIICRLSQDRYNQIPTGDIYNLSSTENKSMLCNPTIPSTQMPTAGYHFTTAQHGGVVSAQANTQSQFSGFQYAIYDGSINPINNSLPESVYSRLRNIWDSNGSSGPLQRCQSELLLGTNSSARGSELVTSEEQTKGQCINHVMQLKKQELMKTIKLCIDSLKTVKNFSLPRDFSCWYVHLLDVLNIIYAHKLEFFENFILFNKVTVAGATNYLKTNINELPIHDRNSFVLNVHALILSILILDDRRVYSDAVERPNIYSSLPYFPMHFSATKPLCMPVFYHSVRGVKSDMISADSRLRLALNRFLYLCNFSVTDINYRLAMEEVFKIYGV